MIYLLIACIYLSNPSAYAIAQALDAWQLEDAMILAEKFLSHEPNNPDAQLAAAQVLHQRGMHMQALQLVWQQNIASPAIHDFQEMLQNNARIANHFEELQTPHFKIHYLNKDLIVAHYSMAILEQAYNNIGQALHFLPAERGEKITVEIYPDAYSLSHASGLRIKDIETSGTIAICKYHRVMIVSPLATANGYPWADTLSHELTHLIISKKSHNTIPIWLHEGIAKYYESYWQNQRALQLSPYQETLLHKAVKNNAFIRLEQMHPSMAKLPSQEDAALAFAEVATLIDYLIQTFGTESIATLLDQAKTSGNIEEAIFATYQHDLKQLETSWKQTLQHKKFRHFADLHIKPVRLTQNDSPAAETLLESIDNKNIHDAARLGELLQLAGNTQAATIEYERAIQLGGAQYATLVHQLSRIYTANNQQQKAVSLLDNLLAIYPDNSDTHLLLGRIYLAQNQLTQAFDHMHAVLLQNPFNPEVHASLQKIYTQQHKTEAAKTEQQFFEICQHPRPIRTYPSIKRPAAAQKIILQP